MVVDGCEGDRVWLLSVFFLLETSKLTQLCLINQQLLKYAPEVGDNSVRKTEATLCCARTYLTKDLASFLILFHIHGAKSDPGGTFGIRVVIRLVLIL